MPTDLFFPDPLDDPSEALAACDRCPVRDACRAELEHDRHAIAGGFTAEQRRALRKGRKLPPATLAKTCAECADRFVSPQPHAKYCPECRPRIRTKQLAEQAKAREARMPVECPACLRRFPNDHRFINHRCAGGVKRCRHCDTEFTTTSGAEYCTSECWVAAKAERAREYGERRHLQLNGGGEVHDA